MHHINRPPPRRQTYGPGEHGYKKHEQQRLGVDGSTHQSEHTIGFEPANRTSGMSRKQNPILENHLPAYQEDKPSHRAHIGTGTHYSPDESGFDSPGYRQAQRARLLDGDVSGAVQLNQLGYAHQPGFQSRASTQGGRAATDSFETMTHNMRSVPYANRGRTEYASVTPLDRAEMNASRFMATTGRHPTPDEMNEIYRRSGVRELTPEW